MTTLLSRPAATPFAALVLGVLVAACGSDPDGPAENGAEGEEKPQIAYLVGPTAGRWHEVPTNRHDPNLTDEQREAIADLESLGYVDGKH